MIKNLFIISLIIILLASCEEKVDFDIEASNNKYVVVDGILTDEYKQQEIRLSYTITNVTDKPVMLSGAEVKVFVEDTVFDFIEFKPGIYRSNPFKIELEKTYNLLINYNGKEYSSSAYAVPVTPFNPIDYYQSVNYDSMNLIFNNLYSQEDAMWEIFIDWSHVPGYENDSVNQALIYFYSLHSFNISELFAPQYKHVYFPYGTIITQKKYSLSPEHAEFARTMLSETKWRGGYFDVEPANISTNMSTGALGFFGVSCVLTDTIYVIPN